MGSSSNCCEGTGSITGGDGTMRLAVSYWPPWQVVVAAKNSLVADIDVWLTVDC